MPYMQKVPVDIQWAFSREGFKAAAARKWDSAPGPDGALFMAYKEARQLGAAILFEILEMAMAGGKPLPGLMESLCVSLPKSDAADGGVTIECYRPLGELRPLNVQGCGCKLVFGIGAFLWRRSHRES